MNKRLQKAVICVLGFLCVLCYGNTQQAKAFKVAISTNIPPSMMLTHVPTTLEKAREPINVDIKVKDAEIDYTWYWLNKVLDRWEGVEGFNRKAAECLSNIGDKGDDGVVVSCYTNGLTVTVIDSRLLMLVIQKQGGIKDSTLDVFNNFVHAQARCLPSGAGEKISSKLIGKDGDRASWGNISVIQSPHSFWFHAPIEWHRTEDTLVFVFEKSLNPPVSKCPPTAEKLFGGARIDDETPYLRFEKSNRREHAEKQFRRLDHPSKVDEKNNKRDKNFIPGRVISGDGKEYIHPIYQ